MRRCHRTTRCPGPRRWRSRSSSDHRSQVSGLDGLLVLKHRLSHSSVLRRRIWSSRLPAHRVEPRPSTVKTCPVARTHRSQRSSLRNHPLCRKPNPEQERSRSACVRMFEYPVRPARCRFSRACPTRDMSAAAPARAAPREAVFLSSAVQPAYPRVRHFAGMSNDPESCMILRFGKRTHFGTRVRFGGTPAGPET